MTCLLLCCCGAWPPVVKVGRTCLAPPVRYPISSPVGLHVWPFGGQCTGHSRQDAVESVLPQREEFTARIVIGIAISIVLWPTGIRAQSMGGLLTAPCNGR